MIRRLVLILTFVTASLAGTAFSFAQETDVESLYDQIDQQSDQASKKEEVDVPKAQTEGKDKTSENAQKEKLPEAKTITELNQLQPFSDIAVIERRYLPKTNRFELSAVGMTNLNNPFFNSFGASGKIAYYLSEQWGVEGIASGLGVAGREVTNDLANQGITTSNVVTARNFFGAAVKWNPIYGKVSFLNHNIVPFDMNFSLGGGVTGTDQGYEEPTVHIGTNQLFALTKSIGVRWDIDWNFYQAHAKNQTGGAITIFQNDLFFGIGISLYLPGAEYR